MRMIQQSAASYMPLPTRNLALNRGMCPDWEINQQTPGSWDDAQPSYPHQPGFFFLFYLLFELTV